MPCPYCGGTRAMQVFESGICFAYCSRCFSAIAMMWTADEAIWAWDNGNVTNHWVERGDKLNAKKEKPAVS